MKLGGDCLVFLSDKPLWGRHKVLNAVLFVEVDRLSFICHGLLLWSQSCQQLLFGVHLRFKLIFKFFEF